MRTSISRLALSTLAALAACSDPAHDHAVDAAPGADAPPAQVIDGARTLGVGEIIEGTLTGGPADAAGLHLTAAPATLDWNLHGHTGSGTQTVAEGFAVAQVDHAFVPTASGDWFVLLRNSGTAPIAVTIRLELYGAMTWSGWQ